jgi:hypothetical protein|tara:strand:- start:475 stop:1158 length:684 start_codon:yes stop_codon:yes gene_type:complete
MYDAVFISYNEPDADERYKRLLERYPNTKRVHGVKGIHQAHIEAAKKCYTKMFWVIDGDADLLPEFNLDHKVSEYDLDCVHVWRSRNPINDLVYGYGGVKLLPRRLTMNVDVSSTDMTTSISDRFKAMPFVSNVTSFNTDEFSTWKSAFRECAKLSSKVIDRQEEGETNERLKVWTTRAHGRFCEFAIRGARAGMEFGLSSGSDLRLINDFDWLQERFHMDEMNDTI